MLETLFPNVTLAHTGAPKKIVAANGVRIRDMGVKANPLKLHEGSQFKSTRKIAQAKHVVVLDESQPTHSKPSRWHGNKLDVNKGFCTVDIWAWCDEPGTMIGICASSELVRLVTVCRSHEQECDEHISDSQQRERECHQRER